MEKSKSDQCMFIVSEEDDEYVKEDGNNSDSWNEYDHQSLQYSVTNSMWPRSFRQSIDMYSNVPSPRSYHGKPPLLSRLRSMLFGSSLTERHSMDILPSLAGPLLHPDEEDDQVSGRKKSSHSSEISHEIQMSRKSSYGQAVLNSTNILCGIGILSTPYAVKEGGWIGLAILLVFAVISFYTGLLLRSCLDSQPGVETYPNIGQAAFGNLGRFAIVIILYTELYSSCVEYIILESDNLSSLFPNAQVNLGGFVLDAHHIFALLATLTVLPTVFLRDLSILSFVSAGGVIASILAVLILFWVGVVDDVNIQAKGTPLNLSNIPVAVGLYGVCFAGHSVIPNIYTSMADRRKFPAVLLTSFAICTFMYAGTAVMGYRMFGEATQSQFTLNLPQDLVASKIAVWTTVINPLTKFAVTISPVAMSLEELIPPRYSDCFIFPIFIRTALVISILIVGLTVPFFGLVLALIGSLLTMLVTFILPCACFLKLSKKVTNLQAFLCTVIIVVGIVSSTFGTYSALSRLVENFLHES